MTNWSTEQRLRYSRQIALRELGEDGQRRLAAARVLVIGLGGLGSPASTYLAASGVGTLLLSDFDTVDLTNLQRQPLYRMKDLDQPKTAAAIENLTALNPDPEYVAIDERLQGAALAEHVRSAEVVLDASDNFGTRFAVNAACVAAGTPLVSGAAIRFEGQVATFRLDLPDSPCYRCLYDETDEEVEDCRGQGVLAPLVGVIGSMMAVEAIKILAGCGSSPHGRLLLYNALDSEWREIKLPRDEGCPVCSRHG